MACFQCQQYLELLNNNNLLLLDKENTLLHYQDLLQYYQESLQNTQELLQQNQSFQENNSLQQQKIDDFKKQIGVLYKEGIRTQLLFIKYYQKVNILQNKNNIILNEHDSIKEQYVKIINLLNRLDIMTNIKLNYCIKKINYKINML